MTTSLKVQYLIGTTGFILMAFSGGMVTMASVVGYPPISYLSAITMGMFGVGLAITIKMLSTMKKIEFLVEEAEE
jgi:hypothetical protein